MVRAANDPKLIDKPFRAPPGEAVGKTSSGVPVTRYRVDDASVLGLETPITFSGTPVGELWLALPEKPLQQVAQLSISLMVALVLITVLAVAIAMYFVANWFAQPIKLVGESMGEIAKGRFDHRIGEQRKDEFGPLCTRPSTRWRRRCRTPRPSARLAPPRDNHPAHPHARHEPRMRRSGCLSPNPESTAAAAGACWPPAALAAGADAAGPRATGAGAGQAHRRDRRQQPETGRARSQRSLPRLPAAGRRDAAARSPRSSSAAKTATG